MFKLIIHISYITNFKIEYDCESKEHALRCIEWTKGLYGNNSIKEYKIIQR